MICVRGECHAIMTEEEREAMDANMLGARLRDIADRLDDLRRVVDAAGGKWLLRLCVWWDVLKRFGR